MPKAIILLFVIDLSLCFIYVFDYIIGQPLWKLTIIIDLNGESSLCAWYSSIKLFCIFLLGALLTYLKYNRGVKIFALAILTFLFLFMSADEIIQIHEWLGDKSDFLLSGGSRKGTFFHETGIWMFVFGLPFIALFVGLIHSVRKNFSDRPSSLKKIVAGMSILLCGALGFEIFYNFVEGSFLITQVVFEEGFEMIGATIIFWAYYDIVMTDSLISGFLKGIGR